MENEGDGRVKLRVLGVGFLWRQGEIDCHSLGRSEPVVRLSGFGENAASGIVGMDRCEI